MNENYLHFLWKNKRLPLNGLQTVDGEKIEILHAGVYNLDSGPDFFNGQIVLDGIRHSGNIEMHVKSSDWNLHGHQFDKAYSNVILHVVYEFDQLIFVEGIPVPTIELKQVIDWEHFDWFSNYYKRTGSILCETSLGEIARVLVRNQIERAFFQRMDRKAAELESLYQSKNLSFKEVLFHTISKAFGMKVNQLPFQELAVGIPFDKFIKATRKQKMAIAFGVGGFLEESRPITYHEELKKEWGFQRYKLKLEPVNAYSWKFKGCRPGGFPTQRLAQFATFVHEMSWDSDSWYLPAGELLLMLQNQLMKPPHDYWITHFDFGKEKKTQSALSIGTANTIIINSVVPFLWWLSHRLCDETYRDKALGILEMLSPEKNEKINTWKKAGITPENAFESQGLIELTNEFCLKKKCLECVIGNTVLKRN